MCNIGDIILVKSYRHERRILSRHSFVVLNVDAGTVKGINYDFVCNVLSSFKSEQQKIKKLGYPGNFEITHEDSSVVGGNTKDGYVKAEQLYYFNKRKIDYTIIENLEVPLEHITTNL